MKKIVKVFSLIIAPLMFIGAFLSGCKKGKEVNIENSGIMLDVDVAPTQTPAYEKYSRQAIEEYKAVADKHVDKDGDVDTENEEVVAAAKKAAAKLYAYACYNERTLDRYVWFSDKRGGTDLGTAGAADVIKQDYYLRINESDKSCGYRYYYTYKYVNESSGLVGSFRSAFEAARLRITVDTDTMYRFQGDNMRIGVESETLNCSLIEADWKTKNDEWGVKDLAMVKEDFIAPEDIAADIIRQADDYANERQWTTTIHGNINILAENIVKYAMISEDDDGGYLIVMNIDTAVANKDKASVQMLTKENGTSGDCNWKAEIDTDDPDASGITEDTGMKIIFRLWSNGMFRYYGIQERWTGKIVGFSGTADSSIAVNYSYTERDCDMTKNLEQLEAAKKIVDDAA